MLAGRVTPAGLSPASPSQLPRTHPKPPTWRSQTACPWTSARPLDSSRSFPGCSNELARMARPLGSTPITEASWLLQAGPPAAPATVLSASRFPPLARAPCRRPHPCSRQCRGLPSHVLRKSRRPGSRRLHAGHRLANTRAPARLILGPDHRPSFDAVQTTFDTSAAIRSRSPSRSPPDTLPRAFSSTLTTLSAQPNAARGGWSLPPQGDPRGPAILHLLRSTPSSKVSYPIRPSLPRSWRNGPLVMLPAFVAARRGAGLAGRSAGPPGPTPPARAGWHPAAGDPGATTDELGCRAAVSTRRGCARSGRGAVRP